MVHISKYTEGPLVYINFLLTLLMQKARNIKQLPIDLKAIMDGLSSLLLPSQKPLFSQTMYVVYHVDILIIFISLYCLFIISMKMLVSFLKYIYKRWALAYKFYHQLLNSIFYYKMKFFVLFCFYKNILRYLNNFILKNFYLCETS